MGWHFYVGTYFGTYVPYVVGAWDGAFNKDSSAGCGAILWGSKSSDIFDGWDASNSELLAYVAITRNCESAVQSEACAQATLVHVLEAHLENRPVVLSDIVTILSKMCEFG